MDDECGFEEYGDYYEEEWLKKKAEDDAEAERYTIETAKETAETQQLTTSEQEERQTFVITGNNNINNVFFCYAPNIKISQRCLKR